MQKLGINYIIIQPDLSQTYTTNTNSLSASSGTKIVTDAKKNAVKLLSTTRKHLHTLVK